MKRYYLSLPLVLSQALVFSGCGNNEGSDVKKLTQEAEESYPETNIEAEQLQQEVKQLNVEIKKESQERIEEINKKIERSKQD